MVPTGTMYKFDLTNWGLIFEFGTVVHSAIHAWCAIQKKTFLHNPHKGAKSMMFYIIKNFMPAEQIGGAYKLLV